MSPVVYLILFLSHLILTLPTSNPILSYPISTLPISNPILSYPISTYPFLILSYLSLPRMNLAGPEFIPSVRFREVAPEHVEILSNVEMLMEQAESMFRSGRNLYEQAADLCRFVLGILEYPENHQLLGNPNTALFYYKFHINAQCLLSECLLELGTVYPL